MKKVETTEEDELRPEYDMRSLKVRKVGPGREASTSSVFDRQGY